MSVDPKTADQPTAAQKPFFRALFDMKLVMQFWRQHRRRLILMLAFMVVGSTLDVAFPYVMRRIIDGISSGLKNPESFKVVGLWSYAGLLLAIQLLSSATWAGRAYMWTWGGERFIWITRNRVFRRILDLGHRFTSRFPSGDVIERLDQDLNDLSEFACFQMLMPIQAVLTLAFALVVLLRMSWLITVVAVLPVSLTVVVWLRLGPRFEQWFKEWREKMSETSNFLNSSLSGIKLIKCYTMEDRSEQSFREILNQRIKAAVRFERSRSVFDIMFTVIPDFGTLLVLAAGGYMVMRDRLTLGEFVAFTAYIQMLIWPLMSISNFFVAGRRARTAEERIRALEEFAPEVDITTGTRTPPELAEIRLRNVGFRYLTEASPKSTNDEVRMTNSSSVIPAHSSLDPAPALRNINMMITPAARVGIAGTVGSGKSTIMHLLLRIAEPTEGDIYLGNVPLKEFDVRALHELFGYAPQEACLISDTIFNNITLGRETGSLEATEHHAWEVARIAQIAPEIERMSGKLQETIGERGVRLSGGQQGRVSIARALFGRPRILLLDDVTASLDAETELDFVRDVTGYMGNATLVIVSHRLSILAACDIVYVMDQGQIVESGTHTELLAKHGTYWKLYERQIATEQLERE